MIDGGDIETVWDRETGEVQQLIRRERDEETGELLRLVRTRTFHVPATCMSTARDELLDLRCLQKQRLQSNCIEKSMVCGAQNVSPIVFMLPTLLFFPAWASILCVICEAAIHVWSHKRNKLTNGTHYRSPLHLISSEFCAPCRSDKWMRKISMIQDKRSRRRKLIHPEYMLHVVR